MLRAPELDAGLQVGSHQSGGEGQDHLSCPAGHAAFDAVQDMVGFLGCKCTLTDHVELLIVKHPQVLLLRAAFSPFIPQLVLVPGLAPTHVQDLALGVVEPHEVHMAHFLSLSRSCWIVSSPSGVLTSPLSVVSSANLLRVHFSSLSH